MFVRQTVSPGIQQKTAPAGEPLYDRLVLLSLARTSNIQSLKRQDSYHLKLEGHSLCCCRQSLLYRRGILLTVRESTALNNHMHPLSSQPSYLGNEKYLCNLCGVNRGTAMHHITLLQPNVSSL